MKKSKKPLSFYWDFINDMYPKHRMGGRWNELYNKTNGGECTDEEPNGWGNFGCKRCNLIHKIETKKKIDITSFSARKCTTLSPCNVCLKNGSWRFG